MILAPLTATCTGSPVSYRRARKIFEDEMSDTNAFPFDEISYRSCSFLSRSQVSRNSHRDASVNRSREGDRQALALASHRVYPVGFRVKFFARLQCIV